MHLKVAGKDFHEQLRQVHLRPFVLVMLLYELIEQRHAVFEGNGSAVLLKVRMRKDTLSLSLSPPLSLSRDASIDNPMWTDSVSFEKRIPLQASDGSCAYA